MTSTLLLGLAAPPLAGLLAWTGLAKLTARALPARAARTALPRLTGGPARAAHVLRALGAAELLLAAWLLAGPAPAAAGGATALLGAAFLGYLGWARAVAPESSCGCAANDTAPLTWHSLARAGLVAAGGAAVLASGRPWWRALADRPAAGALALAAGTAVLAYLSAAPERRWQVPLRRLRVRLFGNPLAAGADGSGVPVAATVELLERSLAWETAAPLIRSGLIEHWDADGWRILHYAGAHRSRPVSVLFALDARAHLDRPTPRAVRVSVLDRATSLPVEEAIEVP